MTIRDWPLDERPREKLAAKGAASLSDSELLAILIRVGIRGRSALDIGRELSGMGLEHIALCSVAELSAVPGMGDARAVTILAAMELGRRAGSYRPDKLELSSPEAVYRLLGPRLNHLQKERFIALALNSKNRLMREELISEGDLNSSIVNPREVFAPLIRWSAAGVIFAHNHPSGDPTPSQRDIEVTRRLKQVGDLLNIKVLDHIIVASGGFYSFQSHGFLPPMERFV